METKLCLDLPGVEWSGSVERRGNVFINELGVIALASAERSGFLKLALRVPQHFGDHGERRFARQERSETVGQLHREHWKTPRRSVDAGGVGSGVLVNRGVFFYQR